MNQRTLAIATLLAATFVAVPLASAKTVKARAKGNHTTRPLTTPKGDINLSLGPMASPKFGTFLEDGITTIKIPGGIENVWLLNASAAYGITRTLEAGIGLPPIQLSPDGDAGDLPVFFTWMSSNDDMDFGARATLTVPLGSEEDGSFWGVNPGLHSLLRFDGGRMDLGVFFPLTFASVGDESRTIAGINVPLRGTFQVSKMAFVGFDSGLRKADFDADNDLFIPLGFHAGYTIKAGHFMIDLTGAFMWQGFFWAGAPEDTDDQVLEDFYSISFGANVHFDISNMTKN